MQIRVSIVTVVASGALACSSSSGRSGGPCSDSGEGMDARACTVADGGKDAKPMPGDCGAEEASAAPLAALSVTSSTGADLVPGFSPSVYDYYVRCASGTTSLSLSAKAASGSSASVALESPGGALESKAAAAAEQHLSLAVHENQAIVTTVTRGAASQEYWVRCLPGDFPQMQWTPMGDACRTPGYYLWGTMSLPPNVGGFAILLDTNGVPVWYAPNGGAAVYDAESLEPGEISFSSGGWHVDTLSPWKATVPSADGSCPYSCGTPDEHELRILSNGNYIGFSSASQTGVNLTGLVLPDAPDGGVETLGASSTILACDIYEFTPAGEVVWTWRATDHFDPAKVMVVKGQGDLTYQGCNGGPDMAGCYVEPFHCNAIDVDPSNGNLLVSARHMASIFYIEKATGKVLWKMGGSGPDSCLDNPPPVYVNVSDPFTAQHDARLQPGWKETCTGASGQISLFDDESYTTNPARGVVYDVHISGVGGGCVDGGTADGGITDGGIADAGDGGTASATVAWQYVNDFQDAGGVPSSVTGGFRISADGSRVICWGQSDPQPNGLVFTEVDEQKNRLLDLICPDDSSSYRAIKYPLSAFDASILRKTSGQ
jgi:hypothetical protein